MLNRIQCLLFLILCCCGCSQAVEITNGPLVAVTSTSATIQWKTDVVCGTRAQYGLSADKLDRKAGEGVSLTHEVQFTELQPGTTYFYSVGTAKVRLKEGTFTTAGISAKDEGSKKTSHAPPAAKPKPEIKPAPAPIAPREAPPTRQTWNNVRTLQDHYDRHGADFRATSPDDYAKKAWEFLQHALDVGLPAKFDDSDDTLRIFDPKTRAFAAYTKSGRTKTYFRPNSPDYFNRQPGKVIKLKR